MIENCEIYPLKVVQQSLLLLLRNCNKINESGAKHSQLYLMSNFTHVWTNLQNWDFAIQMEPFPSNWMDGCCVRLEN